MHLAITGGTGLVGWPIVVAARALGHRVTLLSRRPPPAGLPWRRWELGGPAELGGVDVLVHAAFAHVPGRYRGGEGDDPEGFRRLNLDGTRGLFREARRDGVRGVVFLSSRAVWDGWPAGTRLDDDLPPRPTTLYGEVKRAGEEALLAASGAAMRGWVLRPTGVWGPPPPGRAHKWEGLFRDFLAGRTPAPRRGTELAAADLAAAVLMLPTRGAPSGTFGVPGFVLDRRDLMRMVRLLTGVGTPLPPRAPAPVSQMTGEGLAALGWRGTGRRALFRALPELLPAGHRQRGPAPGP